MVMRERLEQRGDPAGLPGCRAPSHEPTHECGWSDENSSVHLARLPLIRRAREALQVEGMAVFDWLPSERRHAAGINTRTYYTYPLLFYGLFPGVSLAQLRTLSLCGSLLFDYALCLDRLIDQPERSDLGALLLSQRLQREALGLLAGLFGPEHRFWGYFERYTAELMQAALRERARHHHLITPYDRRELEQIYAGKAALAKVGLAALALLDGSQERLARLEAAHDDFYVGFQLFDDLQDWRQDYQSCRYSYPLTLALLQAGWRERAESARRPMPDELGELLHGSGVLEHCRRLALEYLARAESRLETQDDGGWAAMVAATRQHIACFRFDQASPPSALPETTERSGAGALDGLLDTPVAAGWRPWLDPARAPQIPAALQALQQQHLRRSAPPATLGLAVCRVGLAIGTSLERCPEQEPALHLGMRPAELAWCQANQTWLEALLALALDAPAQDWTPADGSAAGWLSPAIGRFLGLLLVQSARAERGGWPTPEAALADYRQRQIR